METCPPIRTQFPLYIVIQRVMSCFSIPINLLSIYCIIFKSTKAMSTYRWHLLWHQILTGAVDFLIGVMSVPIYLMPFPLVYPTSFINRLMPTHIAVVLIFLLITTSLAAVVQLFIYRYLKATGRDNFPWYFIVILFITYSICATPSVGFELIYVQDQKLFLYHLRHNYSCITMDVISIPGLAGYPPELIGTYVGIPIVLVNVFMVAACTTMIVMTKNFLRGNSLSPSTAKLERKFLITLILQVLSPIIIVHTPGLILMYIQANKVYGFEVVGLVCVGMLSVYGGLCGLFIIILTPYYHTVFCCYKPKVNFIASSIETTLPASNVGFFRRWSVPQQRNEKLFIRKT